jgi:hypothetical protein
MSNHPHPRTECKNRVCLVMDREITFTYGGEIRSGRIIDATYWEYIDSEQMEVAMDGPGGFPWVPMADILTGMDGVPPMRR